ncbi:hypothetical protein CANCADRAFT_57554 [Tortispora caseinolytica NRRL Y-17796]|uniref:RING-type E3 ubiquitin transferase n=1 Tax=Tortispora caseinolytica NRRL Y-17796 TaxID=767744 RepID=A0A1E4THV5_9ASCO|nr:hypothetical protein CANCADRAFT_57554 [Tortispora caseinolytica NRRL Y-17796]
MATLRSIPTWQADSDANQCPLCKAPFSFFNRRHHCRHCGRVVCNSCSTSRLVYPTVIAPPNDQNSENPQGTVTSNRYLMPLRTCDQCSASLLLSRSCDDPPKPQGGARAIPAAVVDDRDQCPICGKRLDLMRSEDARIKHVSDCLTAAEFSGSPDRHRRYHNRMVSYPVTANEIGKECIICFEEFKENDVIGRLECLCFFHKQCIKDWFDRKGPGNCPVHAIPQ